MKPKLQFKTIDDLLVYLAERKIDKDKFHPYICPDCGMWHIGHNKGKDTKLKEGNMKKSCIKI